MRRTLCTLAALGGLAAMPAVAPAAPKKAAIKVMTRNVYLGGDITRPISAAAGCQSLQDCLTAAGNAAHVLRGIVDRTDFPARATLLAAEIERHRPDLIGLQEVALWRGGPPTTPLVTDAAEVEIDFLAILRERLRERGLRYRVVVAQRTADVEAPSFEGPYESGKGRDRRLTMRDVILARTDRVKVRRKGGGHYDSSFAAPVGGLASVRIARGYAWADVTVRRRRLRFVNTHLESFLSRTALRQATQLVREVARKGPAVLVGDFNSDPLDASRKPGDPTPHHAAYRYVTRHGFRDAWKALRTRDPGYTSGFGELLDDPDTSNIDHRIDFVFTRGFRARTGAIVGTDPAQRTPSGLWPSDHAGVVIQMR